MTKRQNFLTKNLIKNATTRIALHTHTHTIFQLIDKIKFITNIFVKKTTFYRCRGHPDTS